MPRQHLPVILLAALLLGAPAASQQMPTTVYVYNHDPRDNFDNNAEAFVWQQLGLLDANGDPVDPIPPAQIIRDPATNAIIGYRNAAGTIEAYDVNSVATTDQAWMRVANGGTFNILKHGVKYRQNGMVREGGGIRLDGGDAYDGFGTGTGVGYTRPGGASGPYGLTARPNAGITVNLCTCFSSNDPDGNGPQDSVRGSAMGGGINGAGAVNGHAGRIWALCNSSVACATPEARQAALRGLRAAARRAGYPPRPRGGGARPPTTNAHVADWISSLPSATRYDTVQGIINGTAGAAGVKLRLNYTKTDQAPAGAAVPAGNEALTYSCPTQIFPSPMPEEMVFSFATYDATAIGVPPGALQTPALFQINPLAELPAPLPPGEELDGMVFDFRQIGGLPLTNPVDLFLPINHDPFAAQVLFLDEVSMTWGPPPGFVNVDPFLGEAMVQTNQLGVYTVTRPAGPLPPEFQVNHANASMDWDLVLGDDQNPAITFVAPTVVTVATAKSALGAAPFDVFVGLTLPLPLSITGIQTPGGQIFNGPLLDPTAFWINGGPAPGFGVPLPPAGLVLPAAFPPSAAGLDLMTQAVVLDPGSPEGFRISQAAGLRVTN